MPSRKRKQLDILNPASASATRASPLLEIANRDQVHDDIQDRDGDFQSDRGVGAEDGCGVAKIATITQAGPVTSRRVSGERGVGP